MKQSELDFIQSLRQSSHYIEQHRGKTFVLYLPGELLDESDALLQLSQDITLLHNLNINLVLAMGATTQIDQALEQQRHAWQQHLGCRITPTEILPIFQKTIGQVRSQLEAIFCATSHQQTQPLTIVSGNWVIAQPKGVIDGIDFGHTGILRKVNIAGIQDSLNAKQIVLLTPLAYSLTGEVFNLNTFEQACEIAKQLKADKLMVFEDLQAWLEPLKSTGRQISQWEFEQNAKALPESLQPKINQLRTIYQDVKRIHILHQNEPSSLLTELFTRDGSGLLIFSDHYHQIRSARHEDISAIIELITPLESKGILVKRSRERLELEIDKFTVIERDHCIIGCAALYEYSDSHNKTSGELACLAVHQDYQGQQLGEQLLHAITQKAQSKNLTQLFLLTTQTYHWFIEHGFELKSPEDLPAGKQELYNYQRQSKVLIKPLKTS
ncbi:amino-acid N-acetyltransferase [Thiomicrorhabdus indica]|uniref:amino-acid N-acetyltransferase n=1 Tax=Thiomicrorhabdus indica TaxID=2267253 RepID=UPI00102D834B|nr:amino-acid N-acetyltransferase [Thiomicrorhabdus indica]